MEIPDRVRSRLTREDHIWLTTVSPSGQPYTSLVWFLPDGANDLIIYSLPSLRSRNIGQGAKVALNFNSHGGGGVATFTAHARIDDTLPPVAENTAYLSKYRFHIEHHLGMGVDAFSDRYHVPIRVTLTGVRAW